MADNMIRISWNSGEMEIAAGAIAFAPLADLRKLIFPHLTKCSDDDKKEIISCIVAEYSYSVNIKKINKAKALFSRLSEFCTACKVELPADLPEIGPEKPDYNYKINYKKLARIESIPVLTEEFTRCTVPITRDNNNTGSIECYAGDGYGMLINGIPCYAQKVKSNLFIFNCCGASAASIQWKTAAAARDGLKKAFSECLTHSDAVEKLPELYGNISKFMQLPEFSAPEISAPEAPEDQTPAEEITAPAPEDQAAPAEDQTPTEPAAPAPAPAEPERPKAKRRAAPDWVGKTMTAYPKKPKKPDWIGRKMIITIGERYARPAGA